MGRWYWRESESRLFAFLMRKYLMLIDVTTIHLDSSWMVLHTVRTKIQSYNTDIITYTNLNARLRCSLSVSQPCLFEYIGTLFLALKSFFFMPSMIFVPSSKYENEVLSRWANIVGKPSLYRCGKCRDVIGNFCCRLPNFHICLCLFPNNVFVSAY